MKYRAITACLLFFMAVLPASAADRSVTAEPLGAFSKMDVGKMTEEDASSTAAMMCQSITMLSGLRGAAYVPGVDVNGKRVAPAEVDDGLNNSFGLPQQIDVPITVDLAQHIGIKNPKGLELDSEVGKLSIMNDGKILYNGKDITENVTVYCKELDVDVKK